MLMKSKVSAKFKILSETWRPESSIIFWSLVFEKLGSDMVTGNKILSWQYKNRFYAAQTVLMNWHTHRSAGTD
jgi:hypothetical protein